MHMAAFPPIFFPLVQGDLWLLFFTYTFRYMGTTVPTTLLLYKHDMKNTAQTVGSLHLYRKALICL